MGEKLVKYFEEATRIGGIEAKVRLAMLSLTPSMQAQQIPDTPENIEKLEKAIKQLKTELEKK